MSEEIMIPVDSECIPDGYKAQRFGYGETGETVVQHDQSGVLVPTILTSFSPKFPRLIIRKKYDPGIPLPKGWWVWNCPEDSMAWIASPLVGVVSGVYILGIEHTPGFRPPPDGKPRQIT
jgi:hypothetical protein